MLIGVIRSQMNINNHYNDVEQNKKEHKNNEHLLKFEEILKEYMQKRI